MTKRLIYYDTETTGIRPDKDKIIEIAAYDPLEDRQFVSLVNPGCPIPSEATEIHKITDAMVADAPSFAEVAKQFTAFCREEAVLIAHNNDAFDKPFVTKEFSRHEVALPASWVFLDSLKWARRYRPDLPRHSLQFLRQIYGIPPNQAHRALDDVVVLHEIFKIMIDDLPIDEVIRLITQPKVLQHMPFGKYQGQPLSAVPKDYVAWLASSGAFDKEENAELKSRFAELQLI